MVKALRTTILPGFLILASPVFVLLIWWACHAYDGAFTLMLRDGGLARLAREFPWPTVAAGKIILAFALFEGVLMIALPGKKYFGPVTPAGERNEYKLNGVPAWAVTHAVFYLTAFQFKWFSPAIVYDHFGSIITTCSLFALAFCLFLYFKGSYFPSSRDHGRSGNPIFDYFWGTELHPRLAGFDLKQFCNCRLGMMGWSLIIISFAAKQYELYGHVSNSMLVVVGLQVAYIAKFFWWESGYFATLDVMHDRFGFYICWGVCTFLPVVYTSQSMYLVKHPIELAPAYAIVITAAGLLAIYINYAADAQRQRVRETAGQCTVWGKPPEVIVARYGTSDGQAKESLLLTSGWWGVARHFHYVAELVIALSWSIPCGFTNLLPFFYPMYLTILLTHRALRDDRRCREKYGDHWIEYCARVPYRIVPGVF